MGNAKTKYKNEQQEYEDIKKIINKILAKYQPYVEKYKDNDSENENYCSNIAIFYYNELIHLPDDDILKKGTAIGLIHPDNDDTTIDKIAICSKIIDYYRQRVELLMQILDTIEIVDDIIQSFDNGNLCLVSGNSNLRTEEDCNAHQNGEPNNWLSSTQYIEILKNNGYRKTIIDERRMLVREMNEYNYKLKKRVNMISQNMIYMQNKEETFEIFRTSVTDEIGEIKNNAYRHKDKLINIIKEMIKENK
jgi:hypothetical protein